MNEIYELEKKYWTEKDFDVMGWHDNRIHSLSFDSDNNNFKSDLLFDIDYIFEWVNPTQTEKLFTFRVSPCTLIFHDVQGLKLNFNSEDYFATELEIQELKLIPKKSDSKIQLYQTEIETNFGIITFITSGFEQFVRMIPILSKAQCLKLNERGGISFDKG